MTYLTSADIYSLCNKHQWFTSGSTNQYEKVMSYVDEENITARDTDKIRKVAVMIWMCSSNEITEKEILIELTRKLY